MHVLDSSLQDKSTSKHDEGDMTTLQKGGEQSNVMVATQGNTHGFEAHLILGQETSTLVPSLDVHY
jgi:hypothetical protein